MKELRCIVLNHQEVAEAIVERWRRLGESLSESEVFGVSYDAEAEFKVVLYLEQKDGSHGQAVVVEEETIAAVIAFCVARKIPLPADSEKFIYLVNGNLTLMITKNFNRQPRCVFGKGGERRSRRITTTATTVRYGG
jgi:hypothetical protein